MSKPIIPIFYACDDTFSKYTMVSLQSLMENASTEYDYHIHILSTDLSQKTRELFLDMADEPFSIDFVDVTSYLRSIANQLPLRDYYSYTTYYRLFIAEMFPEYDKVLYLDSDTVILGDISRLYNTNIAGYLVAAVQDQAIYSTTIFQEYVEQVLGVGKDAYFNAGILLINTGEFRSQKLLDQFINLLYQYNFVVAQDQDYLNVLCKDRVLYLDRAWNLQVFGIIPLDESAFQLIHYIMVSKPWHYKDCRYQSHFWHYAAKTAVYREIRQELQSYTDEERKRDADSAVRLTQMAREEIDKENNYLKLKNRNRLKSQDRIDILRKISVLESEGKFDQDVENDPPGRELLPEEIDYLRQKPSDKFKTRFSYLAARLFLKNILRERQLIIKEIKGIENYNSLETGAVVTCNHINAFDSFAMQMAYEASSQKQRTFFRVIREGNYTSFPGFYGLLMRNCYTLPLSSNKNTMRKFIKAINTVLRHGDLVLFYPEQSMWWNYRKPKPLKKGAYTFASRNHVPILPCFITMDDSDVLGEDGFYVQEYTIYISEPIYPDPEKNHAENVQYMMAENYRVWKEIYESHYGIELSYTCDSDFSLTNEE